MVTITGTALQFEAPWSWLVALGTILLWIRSHYEAKIAGNGLSGICGIPGADQAVHTGSHLTQTVIAPLVGLTKNG